MPADYVYSTREGDKVFHVFFMCSEAQKIEDRHKKYGKPPSSEQRRICSVCVSEISAFVK